MKENKVLSLQELETLRKSHPKSSIVHCHGVFDVLHAGHLAYFESAKKFGDLLVVTLTCDEFVNKGPGRPYFNHHIRAKVLASLEIVDYVAISQMPTAVPVIKMLKPDFYVKGPDYRDMARDPTGGIYAEEDAVKSGGGKLVFTDDETFSSSTLVNKFFAQWSAEQQAAIDAIRKAGGYNAIEEALGNLSQEKVHIIGEPIVDTYVFCLPEGISSKSPTISAKFQSEENYTGGSLAIANHLADFAGEVTLSLTHGGENYFASLLGEKLDRRVKLQAQVLPNIPTPRKTRFLETLRSQRVFEITNLTSDQWFHHDSKEFISLIEKQNSDQSTTILADFGHGLFEGPVLEAVSRLKGFVGINVQTNSSNLGFNPFTKHKNFSYLSIDTKEARIAYHDRFISPPDLARKIKADLAAVGASFSMTLGPNGAFYFPKTQSSEIYAPAFSDNVVDATGAGDAFFALTAMLVRSGCPDLFVPFIGNLFAGLKTKIIGNKSPVPRAQLLKAIGSILK